MKSSWDAAPRLLSGFQNKSSAFASALSPLQGCTHRHIVLPSLAPGHRHQQYRPDLHQGQQHLLHLSATKTAQRWNDTVFISPQRTLYFPQNSPFQKLDHKRSTWWEEDRLRARGSRSHSLHTDRWVLPHATRGRTLEDLPGSTHQTISPLGRDKALEPCWAASSGKGTCQLQEISLLGSCSPICSSVKAHLTQASQSK